MVAEATTSLVILYEVLITTPVSTVILYSWPSKITLSAVIEVLVIDTVIVSKVLVLRTTVIKMLIETTVTSIIGPLIEATVIKSMIVAPEITPVGKTGIEMIVIPSPTYNRATIIM